MKQVVVRNGVAEEITLDATQQAEYMAELDAARAANQAVFDAMDYAAKRSMSYPPLTDQLDKIFHEGLDAWKADIQAVKDKYPKA